MRTILGVILIINLISSKAVAIPITLFMDTDTFLRRAKDMIVAECISVPPMEASFHGLQMVEVNILKVLKGTRKPERFRVATIYPMKPHSIYMLYSSGGNTQGTDFLALPELSVVPMPRTFKVASLDGKDLKEQVQYMFSLRLFEVERTLAPLLKEKELLEKAISDKSYEWYKRDKHVKLGPIAEVSTQTDKTHPIWLDLEGERLQWSQSSPGKSGFFYFEKMGTFWEPYWEFSPCAVNKIEDLANKPLQAKFYGMYTPGRAHTSLRWTGLQAIYVSVGQVLLARTVTDPQKVFIIQIVGQKQEQEQMSIRYSVIRNVNPSNKGIERTR